MTLRTRLLLASIVILAVVVVGVVVLLRTQRSFLTDQVDQQLESARPLVQSPPPIEAGEAPVDPRSLQEDAPISNLFLGYLDDGRLVTILQGQLLDDVPAIDIDAATLAEVTNGDPLTIAGEEGATRFRVSFVQPDGAEVASVVALPLDEVDSAISRLQWALGSGTAVIAAALLLAMWWVERLGLRPVAQLTAAADAIARGDRRQRVVGADARTEAGKLAVAFNVMLDERDASEERLRQFIADASHELRTPLTSISGYLDLYREGGFRGGGELDDMVRRMSQESARMHDLVEDLLFLAHLDQHRPLRRERVDLGRLLRDAGTDAQVLRPDRRIVVDVRGYEPIETIGDVFRLEQVVGALVNNALTYTEPDAEVRLKARATSSGAEITVADTGAGLRPEDASRVFDRFFRGEQSRSRRSGGSGLGLAIARSIVEAHHGSITLHTAPGHGCRFVIALPRRPGFPSPTTADGS